MLGLVVGLSVGSWKEPMCVVFTRVERAEGGLPDCLWGGERGLGQGKNQIDKEHSGSVDEAKN